MIILRSRSLIIPTDEYNLGNDYDTNTATRVFQLDRVMEGIDLANLMFKLDLTYADGTSDTLALDSEVTDDKINLTWTVTKNQLHVPGTVVVQIRALNVDGNMKWSSYIGAFFAEASLFSGADYSGKLTEIEQFETALESERQRVKNEEERQKTENERVEAETKRANAETERWKIFNSNEDARQTAETTRNENESLRQAAETEREKWYDTAKTTYEASLSSAAAAGTSAAEAKKYRDESAQIVTPDGLAEKVVGNTESIGKLKEDIGNLLEEGTQILDWKNAKVVNAYFTSISNFKSSDTSKTVIIPVDYSKGNIITIHRGTIGKRFACGYTSKENPVIGDNLDYVNVKNDAETLRLHIKSNTKNILIYYYNSTVDEYSSDNILGSIMVQYGNVYTGYEPYGEPIGTKDIINKINGNSERLMYASSSSASIFEDITKPISKGENLYFYVKNIVGAKYSDIEFYFFRSDNTYKRMLHNIKVGELYAVTADEDYTKCRIRIVIESTTTDIPYAIYNIFQSNGISAINISAKVYDLALNNNEKIGQSTANNLNTCNIFRKVVACGDSYTAGYITDKLGNVHNVNEDYAWPHYMETITGNTWVNCGHSGANAYTWQTAERGLPKAKASGKAQAYILGLMINDSSSDSNRNLTLGTISDIGTNEMSFYAQYTKVIKELFKISPKAKVFIETCPKIEGDRYVGYNQAVHDIYDVLKSNYPNLHLLDLFKHYNMYTNASLTNDSLAGHYTAIGYQQFAQILSVILSSYINEHISDFQDVAFIEYDN